MQFDFTMYDMENDRRVHFSQGDLDHLDDVLDLFLSFLQGSGYSYVNKIGAVKDNKDEHWTL